MLMKIWLMMIRMYGGTWTHVVEGPGGHSARSLGLHYRQWTAAQSRHGMEQ